MDIPTQLEEIQKKTRDEMVVAFVSALKADSPERQIQISLPRDHPMTIVEQQEWNPPHNEMADAFVRWTPLEVYTHVPRAEDGLRLHLHFCGFVLQELKRMIGPSFSWELTSYAAYVEIKFVEFRDSGDWRIAHTVPSSVNVEVEGADLTEAMLCAALQILNIWASRDARGQRP